MNGCGKCKNSYLKRQWCMYGRCTETGRYFISPKNRKYEHAHSAVGMLPRARGVKITL